MKNWQAAGCVALGLLVAAGGCDRLEDILRDVGEGDCDRPPAKSPRLILPLSASISVSQRPLLEWAGDTGSVSVDVCHDRACQQPIVTFAATGSSVRPADALPAGVVFWRVTGSGGASATWELKIPAHDSGRTGAWGAIPDFNGDGLGDLAVGMKGPNQVQFFPGAEGGPPAQPTVTLSGPAGFGDEAGPAGDLNGDGFCDLAVWISGPPQQVMVFPGGPDGPTSPGVTLTAPVADQFSQMRVVSAGDVNGDGYADLLVGGGAMAQLFLGGPNGVSTTPAADMLTAGTPPDARWPVGGADFTGDGAADAIINGLNGAAFYQDNGTDLVAAPTVTIAPGFGALAGDFNGDGIADYASYAIWTGGPGGPTTSFQSFAGESFYQGVGDVNGDGYSDDLAQVSSVVGSLDAERVYFGSPVSCSTQDCLPHAPLLVPGHVNDGNGYAAILGGGTGDLNGDGYDDIVYGEPGAGSVYVFYGSASGPPSTPSLTLTFAQGFGFSFARL
jgi:hypothetical protein